MTQLKASYMCDRDSMECTNSSKLWKIQVREPRALQLPVAAKQLYLPRVLFLPGSFVGYVVRTHVAASIAPWVTNGLAYAHCSYTSLAANKQIWHVSHWTLCPKIKSSVLPWAVPMAKGSYIGQELKNTIIHFDTNRPS